MCSPLVVLDKIVEKIVDIVIESVWRHLGYLFHYKQNVRNLQVQMDELQVLRRTIEGQIEEAKNRGELIMDNVSAWLNGADGLRKGVETFMHDIIDKENVQCFKVSCPDFISRYRLSKEAEKKMGDVKSLSEKANFGTIAHPAPPPPELQLPSSEEYVSFDSRELVFNRIKEALTDTKVNVVGVYGLGGVGKTSIVEKVGEQVYNCTTANEEISKVSVEELMSLTRLSTLDICIPFLRLLPEDLGFLNLSRFFIVVGSPLSDYGGYLRRGEFSSTSVVLNLVNFENEGLIDFSILERLLGKPKWSIERGGLCPSRSFNNLTELVVQHCGLKYLFFPSCARRLLQLQRLEIRDCGTMEAVIGNFGNEEEKDEEIVTNVISFSQLTTLELSKLPRFISFYPRIKKAIATESHSFPPAQSLFNEKVAFPALEELDIFHVPNITEIWDKKNLLPTDQSFRLLRSLVVWRCEELMNVVPSHLLPRLRNVEALDVYGCSKMEVILVLEEREEEATNKDIIPFPELRSLRLVELESLKAFCAYRSEDQLDFNVQVVFPKLRIMWLEGLGRLSSFNNTSSIIETRPLFNHQVAFPALEELHIYLVPNITEIWDKKNLLPTDQSFRLLRSLKVWYCEELMNVVPSHVLPRLRNVEALEVYGCLKMEVIVVLEEREEEATNKDIVPFPELRSLELQSLENLKAFCAYKSKDQLDFNVQVVFPKLRILYLTFLGRLSSFNNTSSRIETRPLFNHQVAFPALEELEIAWVPNITEIWDKKNLFPTDKSFCLLRSLVVQNCEELMNVVPSHVLPRLRNVESLEVYGCSKMEVIVVLEKREEGATNKDIIPFPELRSLRLQGLENLKEVCAYRSEDQLDFNVQVVFPKLRKQDFRVDLPSLKNFNQDCAIMDESGNRIRLTHYDTHSEELEW